MFCLNAPAVSVVIPCFNCAGTLRRAALSVDASAEIVLVDDGSTDESALVMEELQKGNNRVKVVKLPTNQGLLLARLAGAAAATGTWILPLDADDRLLPGLFKHLETQNADVVHFRTVLESPEGVLSEFAWGSPREKLTDNLLAALFEDRLGHNQAGKMIKHSLWTRADALLSRHIQNKHVVFGEDYLLSAALLQEATSYSAVQIDGYSYIQTHDGATRSKSKKSALKQLSDLLFVARTAASVVSPELRRAARAHGLRLVDGALGQVFDVLSCSELKTDLTALVLEDKRSATFIGANKTREIERKISQRCTEL